MASQIVRAAAQFRAEIIAGEASAVAPLVSAYERAVNEALGELRRVLQEINRDIAAGKTPGVQLLYERNRLSAIVGQVGDELQRIAKATETLLTARQSALVELAQTHAQSATQAALGPQGALQPPGFRGLDWQPVPLRDLEALSGIAGNGSPLKVLLDDLAPSGAARVRDALVQGVALGRDDRVIAQEIKDVFGGNMGRALGMVRTEGMRAYRESLRQAMLENAGVIKAVRWMASLSSDTCPACIAMHGRIFPPDYVMESHPCCRCILVPVTKTYRELGFDGAIPAAADLPDEIQTGAEWFELLPESKKRKILGPMAYEHYRRGDVQLADFLGHRHSDEWGGMYYAKSLKSVLAAKS